MIHTFRAKNYGCLLDVEASLTPLHAFIGPNDSGKSTLLHGLRTLTHLASDRFTLDGDVWSPFDPFLPVRFPVIAGRPKDHGILLSCDVEGGSYTYAVGSSHVEKIRLTNGSIIRSQAPYSLRPNLQRTRNSSASMPLLRRRSSRS